MNITFVGQNPNGNDFVIEGKHARISQAKVAELTKVNKSTVSRWVAQTTIIQGSNVNEDYLSGVALKDFVIYLALDAKRISDDVRNHNIKLLSDASNLGFQMLIDKMAGIEDAIESSQTKIFNEYCEVTDLIFKNTHIKPELIAGVKLSQAQKLLPHLADTLSANRQLLVEVTASESQLLTPSKLGEKLSISAQKVNKRLIDAGLQVKNDNKKSKKEPSYIPTDKGHEFCSFTLSTGSNGDTTSYQQLLWYESVLSVIG